MADPNMPVPTDFDESRRESFHRKVKDKFPQHALWGEFNAGLGGLLYRVTACAEHDDSFTASYAQHGTPPMPERYCQERDLFNFFVTGQSALECMAYSLYTLGEMADPAHFTFFGQGKERRINPDATTDAFQSAFPTSPLTASLVSVFGSPAYDQWADARNVLIHRSHSGRHHTLVASGGVYIIGGLGQAVVPPPPPPPPPTTHGRRGQTSAGTTSRRHSPPTLATSSSTLTPASAHRTRNNSSPSSGGRPAPSGSITATSTARNWHG